MLLKRLAGWVSYPVATQARPVAGDLGGRLEHGALEGRGLADAAGES